MQQKHPKEVELQPKKEQSPLKQKNSQEEKKKKNNKQLTTATSMQKHQQIVQQIQSIKNKLKRSYGLDQEQEARKHTETGKVNPT